MAINKVIFGNTTLMDTTGVTVTPDKMVLGTTALSASGETITGTLGPATQSTDGLMSATDKEKLDDANACAMVGPSAIASFSDAYAADALGVAVDITPVQTGSGDPSPTNVRPISGWTGAKVTRTGKNYGYFPPTDRSEISGVAFSVSNGELNISGTASANANPNNASRVTQYASMPLGPYPAGTYTIKSTGFIGQNANDRIVCSVRYADNTAILDSQRISGSIGSIPDGSGRAVTFTATKPFKVGFWLSITSGTSIDCNVKLMMNLGTEPESYEPYQGDIYDITFPSEAGTVYGGTLDVTKGELVVDRIKITDLSQYNWSLASMGDGLFICQDARLIGIANANSTPLCNKYKGLLPAVANQAAHDLGNNTCCFRYPNFDRFYVNDRNYANEFDFKASLTNMELVYELATPQTYQLTPTQIALFAGVNNVWADCGDVTVGYLRADSLCINRAIAARLDGLDMLGFYIDNDGYICQRIGSDT